MHITENRVLLLIQKKQQWRRLARKQVTSAQETLGRVISSLRVSVMVSITLGQIECPQCVPIDLSLHLVLPEAVQKL